MTQHMEVFKYATEQPSPKKVEVVLGVAPLILPECALMAGAYAVHANVC
jgi:hypothetical protein